MTSQNLLEFLKKNSDKYTSGEELATHFGVTRAGVWKHIKKLQDEGVKIEGVTNKGYKLLGNFILEGEILSALSENSNNSCSSCKNYRFEKITCEVFDSITSTNTYAKTNPKEGLHLICASEQTAGRGRRGNSFYSPKDTGVYFTMAFAPKSGETNTFTLAAAIAVSETLTKMSGRDTKIKWVNDIFCENRKVCGILTEGIFDFESGELSSVIVGIGINIETEDFPDEIKTKAGSVGVSIRKNQLIANITTTFFEILALSKEQIVEKYTNLSLVLGKTITFTQNGETITAKAKSFNLEGNLVCQTSGEEIVLKAGEISIVGEFY
ncbi:MAG: biotin--[acetyl-CoA-carboxylase] ligase [Bacillota bacterium]